MNLIFTWICNLINLVAFLIIDGFENLIKIELFYIYALLIYTFFFLNVDTWLRSLHVNIPILPHLGICTFMETYTGCHTTVCHVHCSGTCIWEDHVGSCNENDRVLWDCWWDSRTGNIFNKNCLFICWENQTLNKFCSALQENYEIWNKARFCKGVDVGKYGSLGFRFHCQVEKWIWNSSELI